MENENKPKQDCDCNDNCCQPPKNKLWTKIVFFVVIIMALSIVAIKLANSKDKSEITSKKAAIEKSGCCPDAENKNCGQVENSASCSPEEQQKCGEGSSPTCCPQSQTSWKNGSTK